MDDPQVRGEELAAFGRWLVRERELRGLGRDEVIRATKLAPGVIEALESGEEGRIPPRAYVVGYLRAYAQAVGLDADDVVLRFQEAAAAEPGGGAGAPAGGATAQGKRARMPAVAAPPGKRPHVAGGAGAPAKRTRVSPRVALAAVVAVVIVAAALLALFAS